MSEKKCVLCGAVETPDNKVKSCAIENPWKTRLSLPTFASACERCIGNGKATAIGMLDAQEDETKEAGPERDKSAIWTDCPQCAYKHLTAAYALASSRDVGFANSADIFIARAIICLREAGDGYLGNADLAAGCLAAAETDPSLPDDTRAALREIRTGRIQRGDLRNALDGLAWPDVSAFVAAHITEALRELPEVGDRVCLNGCFTYGGFDPEPVSELLEAIQKCVTYVKKTYEIGETK